MLVRKIIQRNTDTERYAILGSSPHIMYVSEKPLVVFKERIEGKVGEEYFTIPIFRGMAPLTPVPGNEMNVEYYRVIYDGYAIEDTRICEVCNVEDCEKRGEGCLNGKYFASATDGGIALVGTGNTITNS